jgi:hypothetical protein
MKFIVIFLLSLSFLHADIDYYQESNNTVIKLKNIDINSLDFKKIPIDVLSWYINDDGILLGLKNSFFLSLKDLKQFLQIKDDYNLTLIREYKSDLFLVKTDKKDLLSVIAEINNKDKKLIAHPNFYKKVMKR